MKKLLFFVALLVVLGSVNAQQIPLEEPVYCEASVLRFSNEERELFNINFISDSFDCVCYDTYSETGLWQNYFCEDGVMKQRRMVLLNVAPDCEPVEIFEFKPVPDERCKICPNPIIKSGWHFTQCFGEKALFTRSITAFLFGPDVTECTANSFIEMELRENAVCSGPFRNLGEAWGNIVIGLVIIILLWYFNKKGSFKWLTGNK